MRRRDCVRMWRRESDWVATSEGVRVRVCMWGWLVLVLGKIIVTFWAVRSLPCSSPPPVARTKRVRGRLSP